MYPCLSIVILLVSSFVSRACGQWTDYLPLPPTVIGPITPISNRILVEGVVANAEVIVSSRVDMVDQPVVIASGTSGDEVDGEFYLDVLDAGLLIVDRFLAAQQTTSAGPSGYGYWHEIQITPVVIGVPQIYSILHDCMTGMRIGGLTPGATVMIYVTGTSGTTLLIDQVADQMVMVFSFDPLLILSVGDIVNVRQSGPTVDGTVTTQTYSEGLRTLREQTGFDQAIPPVVNPDSLQACRTNISFDLVTGGSTIFCENEGFWFDFLAIEDSFIGILDQPLSQGVLTVNSSVLRACGDTSSIATYQVRGPEPLPAPEIRSPICPGSPWLYVYNLRKAAAVTVSLFRCDSLDPKTNCVVVDGRTVSASGECRPPETDPSKCPQMIFIPSEWVLDANHNFLVITQEACGQLSPPSEDISVELTPQDPWPQIIAPVYDCATSVRFTGGRLGTQMGLFGRNDQEMTPITQLSQKIVFNPSKTEFRYGADLWKPISRLATPLLYLGSEGCEQGNNSPYVSVQSIPDPLPPPTLVGPVRPGATSFDVSNIFPQAAVYVYNQDDILIGYLDEALATEETIPLVTSTRPVPSFAVLGEGNTTYARQSYCGNWSTSSSPVTVSAGEYSVSARVSLSPLTKGRDTLIALHIHDAVSGASVDYRQAMLSVPGFAELEFHHGVHDVFTPPVPVQYFYITVPLASAITTLTVHIQDPLMSAYAPYNFVIPVVDSSTSGHGEL